MGLSDITPALTERRKRFEFVSGVDGKMATADHPRNEPAPTRDVASVQRIVIQITGQSATNILANRPIEVEHDVSTGQAQAAHQWLCRRRRYGGQSDVRSGDARDDGATAQLAKSLE